MIAGEPSGDLHGSHLINNFKKYSKGPLTFRGIGGPLMQNAGLKSIELFDKLSVMGFLEVLLRLPFFLKLKNKTILDIKKNRPEKIILIDYPGFNLKLAKTIKKESQAKVYFYISPQIWAWKEKRINSIKKYIDEMIVVFPFEKEWYAQRGFFVHYFGHPLIDLYKNKVKKESSKKINVGIFPGSRQQELKNHLPVLRQSIALLKSKFNNLHFIVGVANEKTSSDIVCKLNLKSNFTVVVNNSIHAFNLSRVAIVASGTATLECAISKTPFVVIYKTSFISWVLASFFIKINFASIVNILGKKLIVKELLQKNCSPNLIANQVCSLISSNNSMFLNEMQGVVGLLGDGVSYKKSSNFIYFC